MSRKFRSSFLSALAPQLISYVVPLLSIPAVTFACTSPAYAAALLANSNIIKLPFLLPTVFFVCPCAAAVFLNSWVHDKAMNFTFYKQSSY
jgi:hypothetical protein